MARLRGAALTVLSSRFGRHVRACARISLVMPGVATIGTVLRAEVWYARADDGVTIAYSVVGDGPVTIVVVSPLISQLELAWEEPALEHFWSRFAACARVVMFDRRGAGLSDRSPVGERLGLAALALDIKAVLDACGAGQAVLFGVTFGCPVAIRFAASFPDRTQALVSAGGFAKLTRLGEFDFAADPAQVGEWASRTARGWGSGVVFGANAPAMRDNARYRDWAARMERHTRALPARSRRCAGGQRRSMSVPCWPTCGCRRW
jgi:pimeloyl-ACP methyl ester carboxylesterase